MSSHKLCLKSHLNVAHVTKKLLGKVTPCVWLREKGWYQKTKEVSLTNLAVLVTVFDANSVAEDVFGVFLVLTCRFVNLLCGHLHLPNPERQV